MLVTFQNKLHETTGHTISTLATLHFPCIFLCSSRTFDQSHILMEADCAHELPFSLLAVPLYVKRVCFVSELVNLNFTNIIFIISS